MSPTRLLLLGALLILSLIGLDRVKATRGPAPVATHPPEWVGALQASEGWRTPTGRRAAPWRLRG